jgi:hypothetical protein
LVIECHSKYGLRPQEQAGVPLARISTFFDQQFTLRITPGGLAQAFHRTAQQADLTYDALVATIRQSAVVSPDETGWNVGGHLPWLWTFATHSPFAADVQALLQQALSLRERHAAEKISRQGLAIARGHLMTRLTDRLDRPGRIPDVQRFARHLDREFPAIWSFLFDPTIDATNWRAEHALRPAVVTRKVCGGNRTPRGAHTQAVLASLLGTRHQRHLDPVAVFSELLTHPTPHVAPALLVPS